MVVLRQYRRVGRRPLRRRWVGGKRLPPLRWAGKRRSLLRRVGKCQSRRRWVGRQLLPLRRAGKRPSPFLTVASRRRLLLRLLLATPPLQLDKAGVQLTARRPQRRRPVLPRDLRRWPMQAVAAATLRGDLHVASHRSGCSRSVPCCCGGRVASSADAMGRCDPKMHAGPNKTLLQLFFIASSIATATATDAPTMGLLPMPMRPIISTCAGTDEEPAN